MSRIYTPKDGFITKTGSWNPGTDFVMMTASERRELYSTLANIIQIKRTGVTVPGWSRTDEKIVRNAARLTAPVHRGGCNKDVTLPDLKKLWVTLEKFEVPLKEQLGHSIEWPDCIIPDNFDKESSPYYVSKLEVWEHMEAQRNTTKEQQQLKDNPDMITDDLPEFSSLWD